MTICEIVELYLAALELIDAANHLRSCPDQVELLALHTLVGLGDLDDLLMATPLRTHADRRALAALVSYLIGQCASDNTVPETLLARLTARLGEDLADEPVRG
jgi:hypothetical protein